jgi:hypothetical protein
MISVLPLEQSRGVFCDGGAKFIFEDKPGGQSEMRAVAAHPWRIFKTQSPGNVRLLVL